MSITPFQVSVPDSAIEALKKRLSNSSFPEQLEGPDVWDLGSPLAEVQRLVKYWKDEFDWRKAEASINEMPQFKTTIDVEGFGGPGSFLEVKKLLPLLSGKDGHPAFHVVAPSLPNFGFSDGISKSDFCMPQYAEAFHKLMLRLGYTEYVTQAGDWGFSVTRALALLYPTHCRASHLNLILSNPPSLSRTPITYLRHLLTPYTKKERDGLARTAWFDDTNYAYNLLHSTKPQTISYALADSPLALLSWILEKLHLWTDAYPWTPDEILTWISIYYFSTAGPAASVRIYYQGTHQKSVTTSALRRWIPGVKLGLAYFPREISNLPRAWGRTLGEVVWESEHESGGHFAAWERPEAIAEDLRGMFGKGGPCFGIVEGRDGYEAK
ncbi:MAG: hypothetical protein Q9227_004015 [Pyrenula ochraceoflavens]